MDHQVFQMTSFSRSGETLMQRCLNAHPKIRNVHQVVEPDTDLDIAAFHHIRETGVTSLPSNHFAIEHWVMDPGEVIVVKNAIYIDKRKRQGFVLIRNPFSVAVSAHRAEKIEDEEKIKKNRAQQVRWCKTIDPMMLKYVSTTNLLDSFLSLYTAKMMHDFNSGLPIVRYEDFIADPERELRKIVSHFGLDWDDKVLRSHEDYLDGQIGHGGIKLSQPIHNNSLDRYSSLPEGMLSRIYSLTRPVLEAYGYGWDGKKITLKTIDQRF